MRVFSNDDDEDNAYRTYDGIVGRSLRRGTDKALSALTFGLIKGSNPVQELAEDAAEELVTKVIPRSMEERDDD